MSLGLSNKIRKNLQWRRGCNVRERKFGSKSVSGKNVFERDDEKLEISQGIFFL